jgi:hypothetical protein
MEKLAKKFGATFVIKNCQKSNRPKGEKSPNLVTLYMTQYKPQPNRWLLL